ncbi:MAG: fasciclin domain-containing protein [Scytonematopsis contorta HA4267-MV1]|nr:fasciclin domain-containing protein [Scytonematopsis contorta HA4267-MV1]
MKSQTSAKGFKKLAFFAAGVLMLPMFAACGNERVAEAPGNPAITETIPPAKDVSDPLKTPAAPGATTNTTPGTTSANNLAEAVAANPSLSTLKNLLDETDLKDKLDKEVPYTVFAPSDQAFAAIPEATREKLLQPKNREILKQVLSYHVVPGNLTASKLQPGKVQTLDNNPVNVQVDKTANQVKVNDAKVIQPDIQASNGVIHVVDKVILPPNLKL